jgi:nitroreductase
MGATLEMIRTRRSIRDYEAKEVSQELLNQVLEAVRWSPSWANTQCWEIVVVKDRARKRELQGVMPKFNPARKAVVQVPVLLMLCAKLNVSGAHGGEFMTKFGDWFMFDLGIAAQSVCLAAHDQGLGTVIAGGFDHEKAKKLLGVPEGYEAVAMILMGFPARGSKALKRRTVDEFTHYERF